MAKKDFSNITNPALQFITGADTQAAPTTHNTQGTQETETKSKRLNVLLRPALHQALKKIATMQERSVNDLINDVLGDYAVSEAETIERYNEVFKK